MQARLIEMKNHATFFTLRSTVTSARSAGQPCYGPASCLATCCQASGKHRSGTAAMVWMRLVASPPVLKLAGTQIAHSPLLHFNQTLAKVRSKGKMFMHFRACLREGWFDQVNHVAIAEQDTTQNVDHSSKWTLFRQMKLHILCWSKMMLRGKNPVRRGPWLNATPV